MRRADLALAATALALGCAPSVERPTSLPPARGSFVREVSPFTVVGRDGTHYAHPFFGGMNVPRPQFRDIDGDGDLDLFLQELSNTVAFFENVGTPADPSFLWRTDRFQELDVGEWNRFVDLDRDGDPDLLAEQPFSASFATTATKGRRRSRDLSWPPTPSDWRTARPSSRIARTSRI